MSGQDRLTRKINQLKRKGVQGAAEAFLELEDKLKEVTKTTNKLAKRIEKLEKKGNENV